MLAQWASAFIDAPTDVWGPRSFYGSLGAFAEPAFGWRSLAFAGLLTIATVIIVAWPPALAFARTGILSGLRDGARGTASGRGSLRRPTVRSAIVALEAALAMLLLVAGGLLIDSFQRMRGAPIGVESDHVLTFEVRPSEASVPATAAPAFIARLLDAITRTPGVVSASVDGGAPLSGSASTVLNIIGRPVPRPDEAPPVNRHYVAPDHFRTLGIPLIRGRAFTASDGAGAPHVTIISETAARRFWPNSDPLGQRVWFGGGSTFDRPDSSAEVIGVVGDVAYEPLDQAPNRASFYTPYMQFSYAWRVVFVRTAGDPLSSVREIRSAVQRVEPDMPLTVVRPLGELIGNSWKRHRFDALLFGGFAVLAVLLAAFGIYAVVAFAVQQRTREVGIRMALGADAGGVIRLVVREGMVFPALGLVLGVVAALAFTRVLRASLYEVRATEPAVFGAAVVALFVVSVLACVGPALRAARVLPSEALRAE